MAYKYAKIKKLKSDYPTVGGDSTRFAKTNSVSGKASLTIKSAAWMVEKLKTLRDVLPLKLRGSKFSTARQRAGNIRHSCNALTAWAWPSSVGGCTRTACRQLSDCSLELQINYMQLMRFAGRNHGC